MEGKFSALVLYNLLTALPGVLPMTDAEQARRMLRFAWSNLDLPLLCENLKCEPEEVMAMASGEEVISDERLALLSALVQVLEGSSGLPLELLESGVLPAAIAGEEDPDPAAFMPADPRVPQSAAGAAFGPDYPASSPGDMALDLDGDGVADVSLVGLGGTSRPGTTWRDEEDQRRYAFRNARALAVMTMFRIGMTRQEYVEAIGTVARYELALIAHFREAVPDHTERWDAKRRFREIERRLARLRWVEMEQEKEYGGFRGLFNRARGRRRVTGKELYEKMVSDADDLVMAMAELRPMDELSSVMQFSGLPASRRPAE